MWIRNGANLSEAKDRSSLDTMEALRELDIRPEVLYRWRKEFASKETASFPGNGKKKLGPEETENARLRKELADMRMERDILKKAVGIFSKNDGKYSDS